MQFAKTSKLTTTVPAIARSLSLSLLLATTLLSAGLATTSVFAADKATLHTFQIMSFKCEYVDEFQSESGPPVLLVHGIAESETGMARMAAFLRAIKSGFAYVNVHTTAFGGGEIRGVVTRSN